MKKREELKVTTSPIRLMQNFEKILEYCEHGVPTTTSCSKCNPVEIKEPCKHQRESSGCFECRAEESHRAWVVEEKAKLESIYANPTEILRSFNVPPKYRPCSLETFKGNDKLINECRKNIGESLVLFGNTGCGKTHLAVALMREKLQKNIKDIIAVEWEAETSRSIKNQLFISVPDLLLEIRNSFNDKAGRTEEEIIDHYSKIPFLVLDDLGSEKTSEFSITSLYVIIDRRDRNLKSTIYTTNLSPKEIEDKLGARIASRLSGMKNIKINMPDYRKKRGN